MVRNAWLWGYKSIGISEYFVWCLSRSLRSMNINLFNCDCSLVASAWVSNCVNGSSLVLRCGASAWGLEDIGVRRSELNLLPLFRFRNPTTSLELQFFFTSNPRQWQGRQFDSGCGQYTSEGVRVTFSTCLFFLLEFSMPWLSCAGFPSSDWSVAFILSFSHSRESGFLALRCNPEARPLATYFPDHGPI